MAEEVRTPVGGPSSEVARREDLRDYLPGIETERQVSDWGRSERVEGLVDRTVVDFLYHLWFRCEIEGIENVPAEGAALLVSNHSGALPPDAAMIVKAVKEEHPRPRPVHLTVEHFFKGYPGFRCSCPRSAASPPTRRTCSGCSTTSSSSCWCSRRGARAPRSSTRTATACAASAAAASSRPRCAAGRRSCRSPSSAPRRSMPAFAQLKPLQRLTGFIYFPITPTWPHLGLLGMVGYLPAKFKIRFLPPVLTDDLGEEPWEDKALVQTIAHDVRATIQEELLDMVGKRRSVWFGVSSTGSANPASRACRRSGVAGSRRPSSRTPRSRR